MKTLFNYTFLFATAYFFVFANCKKNETPLEQLPPETQTGANTFGCLIDGKPFTPGGSPLSGPNLTGIYQNLIFGTPAGNTFGVSATDKRNSQNITNIGFRFDSVALVVGIYPLRLSTNGVGGGGVRKYNSQSPTGDIYDTNSNFVGELNLKKFDETNQIASGTFWFDAVNSLGKKIEIRSGRFDVRFTR